MAELAEPIIEEVAERVARTVPLHMSLLGATMTLAGGCLLGYAFAEKRLRTKYQKIADQEIEEMREHFHKKSIVMEEKPALDGLVKDLGYVPAPVPEKEEIAEGSALTQARTMANHIREAGGDPEDSAEEVAKVVERNIFEEAEVEDVWDYEEEVRMRRPDFPYIIHVDEQGEMAELNMMTFTWWEGDEILANEREEAVVDPNRVVGLNNLDKFGHGSRDKNVVYIRNVILGVEIEVIRSTGRFDEEVLGMKHSDESFRRKRHFDDD